ncbi:MAG: PglZ domain-containing protein [Mesorhizobium sp.]|nr:MAG: PglZ domain-containing protein [Mesorhizobium sp.]
MPTTSSRPCACYRRTRASGRQWRRRHGSARRSCRGLGSQSCIRPSTSGRWGAWLLSMRRENCVVISDATRYEVGEELLGRIRNLDRYDAEIEPALASLPTYTQLGMASLLPNKEIRIASSCEPACKQADVVMNSGFPSCGSLKRPWMKRSETCTSAILPSRRVSNWL